VVDSLQLFFYSVVKLRSQLSYQLHHHQFLVKQAIYNSWIEGFKNVLAVLPTGGGKTVIFADIILDHFNIGHKCVAMAHRNELVTQMSTTIAAQGVPHRIIGPAKTVQQAIKKHRARFGKSFINPSSPNAVIGVDTLMARRRELADWCRQIDLWVTDEGHHTVGRWRVDEHGNRVYNSQNELEWEVDPNKWGTAISMFSNAKGLGVTGSPKRTDGQGLGWDSDGVFHKMVEGPKTRWLIDNGYLADYEIVCPDSDLDVENEDVGKNGDWSNQTLRKAAKKSRIVGDVVENYVKYAIGRKAIVFATDVETAEDIARKFNEWGIRAAAVSGTSSDDWREQSLTSFESGDLMVLVNVDLFDEGLDVNGAEVCIMARPTASLVKYLQCIGRVLRYAPGKVALIIDHVSNVIRHGFPDKDRIWTLDREQKRGKQARDPDDIPLTICRTCSPPKPYEAFRTVCPYCGTEKPLPVPKERSIEMVHGDLILLDRETLAKMRAATNLDNPSDVGNRAMFAAGPLAAKGAMNRQSEKIEAHQALQQAIAIWAGYERAKGHNDREIQRLFYFKAGFDVLSALDGSRSRKEFETITDSVMGWIR
jgi:DNA repair protein RadD